MESGSQTYECNIEAFEALVPPVEEHHGMVQNGTTYFPSYTALSGMEYHPYFARNATSGALTATLPAWSKRLVYEAYTCDPALSPTSLIVLRQHAQNFPVDKPADLSPLDSCSLVSKSADVKFREVLYDAEFDVNSKKL